MAKILTVELIEDNYFEDEEDEYDYLERNTYVNSNYTPLTSRAEHLLELLTSALGTQEIKVSDETFEKNLCVLKRGESNIYSPESQMIYDIEEIDPIVGIRREKNWSINFCVEALESFFDKVPDHIYIKA